MATRSQVRLGVLLSKKRQGGSTLRCLWSLRCPLHVLCTARGTVAAGLDRARDQKFKRCLLAPCVGRVAGWGRKREDVLAQSGRSLVAFAEERRDAERGAEEEGLCVGDRGGLSGQGQGGRQGSGEGARRAGT